MDDGSDEQTCQQVSHAEETAESSKCKHPKAILPVFASRLAQTFSDMSRGQLSMARSYEDMQDMVQTLA
jgi:hypothetical protein